MRSYTAKVVFIGNQEYIINGVVDLDEEGTIVNIGSSSISTEEPKKLDGALCPGFINTHCHLELSHLLSKIPEDTGLPGFIQNIQQIREAETAKIISASKDADAAMQKNGIVAVADICNSSTSFSVKKESKIHYHNLVELFGLKSSDAKNHIAYGEKLVQQSQELGLNASIVPHSPYSVSTELFECINRFPNQSISSIHNQETESENTLHINKKGALAELLKGFGNNIETLNPQRERAMQWFLPMMQKDQHLLLVHNTFVQEEDIAFAKEVHPHLYWCFCPQANWYIERKLPNLSLFFREGMLCTLGTDSLASNHELSILEEMKCLHHHFPWVKTEQLIEMACSNGANYLGLKTYGKLEVGDNPGLNQIIGLQENFQINNDAQLKVISTASLKKP